MFAFYDFIPFKVFYDEWWLTEESQRKRSRQRNAAKWGTWTINHFEEASLVIIIMKDHDHLDEHQIKSCCKCECEKWERYLQIDENIMWNTQCGQ